MSRNPEHHVVDVESLWSLRNVEKEKMTLAEMAIMLALTRYDDLPEKCGPLEIARQRVQGIMKRMADELIDPLEPAKGKKGIAGVPSELIEISDAIKKLFGMVAVSIPQSRNLVRKA